jgi:hypothetical protein
MNYAIADKIATPLAAAIFIGTIIAFIILSFILDHHWRNYTTSHMRLYALRSVYLAVSIMLIVVMTGAFLTLLS